MKIEKIELPQISESHIFPEVSKEEINKRYCRAINKLREKELSYLIVYGDREHYANLSYLTGGYDSRFEECLLIIQDNETPVLIVGNEGFSYSDISLLDHKKELFQTFSLQGQIRDKKYLLSNVLKKSGLNSRSKIGIVGIKYYEKGESDDPEHTFDIPHYIIQEIIKLTPEEQIFNVTDLFTHPEEGLRTQLTHHEIARFEFLNNYLSNQMKNVISNLKVGIRETELASYFKYRGIPFSTHSIINFGTDRVLMGLASPSFNRYLKRGDIINVAFGVPGANVARTGYAVTSIKDFTKRRQNIIEDFYYPYFNAIKIWYESLQIGGSTKNVYDRVNDIIGAEKFGVNLNPGHQIHSEEWINSPFREDSNYKLKSGTALQCDIIAFPGEPYVGVHVEDTIILADEELQNELKSDYEDAWIRIKLRRNMMKDILGIAVTEEVMPLSNIQAVLHPFLLDTRYVITAH